MSARRRSLPAGPAQVRDPYGVVALRGIAPSRGASYNRQVHGVARLLSFELMVGDGRPLGTTCGSTREHLRGEGGAADVTDETRALPRIRVLDSRKVMAGTVRAMPLCDMGPT